MSTSGTYGIQVVSPNGKIYTFSSKLNKPEEVQHLSGFIIDVVTSENDGNSALNIKVSDVISATTACALNAERRRSSNGFQNYMLLRDLIKYTPAQVRSIKNVSEVGFNEIQNVLKQYNLSLA